LIFCRPGPGARPFRFTCHVARLRQSLFCLHSVVSLRPEALHRHQRGPRRPTTAAQFRCLEMDRATCSVGMRAPGTLRELLGCAQARVASEKAKERDGFLHAHGSRSRPFCQTVRALGLLIPRGRDRWFKSNPATILLIEKTA